MFSFERTLTEFKSLLRLLSKRHLVMLGVFALYVVLKHIVFFYLEAQAHFFSSMKSVPGEIIKDSGVGIPQIAIFLVTILVSLDVFAKLRHPSGSVHYLTTPSGTADKYTAAWVYSGILTVLALILTYNILHILCTATGNLVTGLSFSIQAFEWDPTWKCFVSSMYIHSFYFLGSAYFNKNAAGKTTLTLIASSVVISIFSSIVLISVVSNTDWLQSMKGQSEILQEHKIEMLLNTMPQFVKVVVKTIEIFLYALPFACWTAAFFALKKKEA